MNTDTPKNRIDCRCSDDELKQIRTRNLALTNGSASVATNTPEPRNETRAVLHVGDKVSFEHYGERKTGIVAKLGKSLVFLTDGRWLHRQSVTSD